MRQKGILDQLHAGHYVSLYKSSYPGNPDLEALHPGTRTGRPSSRP